MPAQLRALALLISVAGGAGAQIPVRWSDDRPSPFTIVLDSTDLAQGRGRTLAAFLSGRVTGLFITAPEGPGTQPPQIASSTTAGNFARTEPRLYIDGVLIRDDPDWWNAANSTSWTPSPPSLGWGTPLDEVVEIRVHLGPAGTGAIRYGGSRGAVLVFTRRGSAERTRVWSALQTTLVPVNESANAPTNFGRLGATSGGATTRCRLADEAESACTPGVAIAWSPLAELVPSRDLIGVRASVGASGRLPGKWAYAAWAADDAGQGVFASNRAHRTDLALSVSRAGDPMLDLELDVRYGRIKLRRGGWHELDFGAAAANWGAVATDSLYAVFRLVQDNMLDRALDRVTDRMTAGARGTMRISPATAIHFAYTGDGLARRSYADVSRTDYCAVPDLLDCNYHDERIVDRDFASIWGNTFAMSLQHRFPTWRALRLEMRTGISQEYARLFNRDRGQFGGGQAGATLGGPQKELAARVGVGDRGVVTATARERFRQAKYIDKHLDGEWDLLRAGPGRSRLGLDRLTMLGAYGESDDVRSIFPAQPGMNFPDFPKDRMVERRFGVAARWLARIELAADRSVTTTSNGTMYRVFDTWPMRESIWYSSWRVEATQVRIGLRSALGASTPWHLELGAVERLGRATDFPGTQFETELPPPTYQHDLPDGSFRIIGEGGPFADIWNRRYTWSDANDDGVITGAEVTPNALAEPLGSTEPRWTLNLTGGVELPGGLSFGAVVESRLGHVAVDHTGYLQCRYSSCEPLYRPGASLESQAAAIAASEYSISTPFIRDASFARAREVFVEYRFGGASRLGGVGIRLTGHNLITATSFPGADPEAITYQGATPLGMPTASRAMPGFSLRLEWQR